MPDSDDQNKESVLRMMDDFLSRLNRTKKLFMALIFATFAMAPLSIVFMVVVLTPSFVSQAGEPYDVAVSFVGRPMHNVSQVLPGPGHEGNLTLGMGAVHMQEMRFGPDDHHNIIVIRSGEMQNTGNATAMMLNESKILFHYAPVRHMEMDAAQMPPPRFMYVVNPDHLGRQTDVTVFIVAMVVISAAIATAWLAFGIKEYRFFSRWSARYSNYKRLQDDLDRDLED